MQVPPLLVIEFIHRICDVLQDYLGEVREDVVKENFVLLYQLLDEVRCHEHGPANCSVCTVSVMPG